MPYLTKSRFTLALECPTKLSYVDDPTYANSNDINDFLLTLAEGGHQIGAFAKCLFPDGIEIDATGHAEPAQQTKELLQQQEVTLFEAAFCFENLFIRVDLLRKIGNVIEFYEVKSKGIDPEDLQIVGKKGGFLSGMLPYLYDAAFQRYVLRKEFPDVMIRSHLVMPNKTVICDAKNLSRNLRIIRDNGRVRVEVDKSLKDGALARNFFHTLVIDEYLDTLESLPMKMGMLEVAFSEGIEDLARRVNADPYPPQLGSQCKKCEFTASPDEKAQGRLNGRMHCLQLTYELSEQQATNGTILDLYSSRNTDALLAAGKVLLADLEPEDIKLDEKIDEIALSHRQWLQSEEARGALAKPFVLAHQLSAQLELLNYPLHFIDFETSCPAIPFHAGRHPYEQLLFQFSHHRLSSDGSLQHVTQHLSESLTELPNFETVRKLKNALTTDNGTILHWWDHERTVLSEIRKQLIALPQNDVADRDDLVAFIENILGTKESPARLFDLGRLFHRTVFLPNTQGSSSLKKVLPAILASSTHLQTRYSTPIYGRTDGIPSLNFHNQTWVQRNEQNVIVDPYLLLGARTADPELASLERLEEDNSAIADGGAAMVAYSLLQSGLLNDEEVGSLRTQLLRYCELDTLAMVFVWEGMRELAGA